MSDFEHEMVSTPDVTLHVTSSGPSRGPAVFLCHGFPETWYSWRHQIVALAQEGYRVHAPDWRGYGMSTCPSGVRDYGTDKLTGDLCELLDHFGYEHANFVGHDWGAAALWDMVRLHPHRVASLYNMSVPFTQPSSPPLEIYEALFADQFFYMNYFREVGIAEAELGSNTRRFLRDFFYSASGEGMASGLAFKPAPRQGTGLLGTLARAPDPLPSWLSEHDLDVYCDAFDRSGFFGPLSFYRNMDDNWRRVHEVATSLINMPVGFLSGSLDPVGLFTSGAAQKMPNLFSEFRGTTVLEGAGHWIQQERPEDVNVALLTFLDAVC